MFMLFTHKVQQQQQQQLHASHKAQPGSSAPMPRAPHQHASLVGPLGAGSVPKHRYRPIQAFDRGRSVGRGR